MEQDKIHYKNSHFHIFVSNAFSPLIKNLLPEIKMPQHIKYILQYAWESALARVVVVKGSTVQQPWQDQLTRELQGQRHLQYFS